MALLDETLAAGQSGHLADHGHIADKLNGVCYDLVADYGADPTGAASCTAILIQATNDIADAGGGTVLIPAGTFAIGGTSPLGVQIVSKSKVRWLGTGPSTILKRTGTSVNGSGQLNSRICYFNGCTDLVFENFAVDFNGVEGSGGFNLFDSGRARFLNLRLYDSALANTYSSIDHNGIIVQSGYDIFASGIHAVDVPCIEFSPSGSNMIGAKRIHVTDCHAVNSTSSSAVGFFGNFSGNSAADPCIYEDIIVSNCFSIDSRKGNFIFRQEDGPDYNTWRNIRLVNCHVVNNTLLANKRHFQFGRTTITGTEVGNVWEDIWFLDCGSWKKSGLGTDTSEWGRFSHSETNFDFNRVTVRGYHAHNYDLASNPVFRFNQLKNSSISDCTVTGAVTQGLLFSDCENTVFHDHMTAATDVGYAISNHDGGCKWWGLRISGALPTTPVSITNNTATDHMVGGQTLGPWVQDNVAASQTNVALNLYGDTTRTAVLPVRPGSVTGIVIRSNEARTAGTLTAEVTINGSGIGLTALLNGTTATVSATTQGNYLDAYVAGDAIGVRITTTGTWTPTTADITVMVEVSD